MALMFQRLAHNYAKNGYFPTDSETTRRVLTALVPADDGCLRLLDPCCGEGVFLAEAKHHLGDRSIAYGIEYHEDRAWHAKQLLDVCIHSDIHDCVMGARSFSLLMLNPPYGDMVANRMGLGDKSDRMEKVFYRMTHGLLQYGGVIVLIIPRYSLDKEYASMIARHFDDVRVFAAPEQRFKQIVVMGVKRRVGEAVSGVRELLAGIGAGTQEVDELPDSWPYPAYTVPAAAPQEPKFYGVRIDTRQLAEVIRHSRSLKQQMGLVFRYSQAAHRRPVRSLSQWHLALALAAGQVSGCVRSSDGRVFVIKGDTFKSKRVSEESDFNAKGDLVSTKRVHTDTFVPTIRALDFTRSSPSYGKCLTIK